MTTRAVMARGLGQCVNWGVLYYAFAVLLLPVEAALGVERWMVAGAFSLALLLSAMAAPAIGRWSDRGHGARLMQVGGYVAAGLLGIWALVPSVLVLYAVWAGLGRGRWYRVVRDRLGTHDPRATVSGARRVRRTPDRIHERTDCAGAATGAGGRSGPRRMGRGRCQLQHGSCEPRRRVRRARRLVVAAATRQRLRPTRHSIVYLTERFDRVPITHRDGGWACRRGAS